MAARSVTPSSDYSSSTPSTPRGNSPAKSLQVPKLVQHFRQCLAEQAAHMSQATTMKDYFVIAQRKYDMALLLEKVLQNGSFNYAKLAQQFHAQHEAMTSLFFEKMDAEPPHAAALEPFYNPQQFVLRIHAFETELIRLETAAHTSENDILSLKVIENELKSQFGFVKADENCDPEFITQCEGRLAHMFQRFIDLQLTIASELLHLFAGTVLDLELLYKAKDQYELVAELLPKASPEVHSRCQAMLETSVEHFRDKGIAIQNDLVERDPYFESFQLGMWDQKPVQPVQGHPRDPIIHFDQLLSELSMHFQNDCKHPSSIHNQLAQCVATAHSILADHPIEGGQERLQSLVSLYADRFQIDITQYSKQPEHLDEEEKNG